MFIEKTTENVRNLFEEYEKLDLREKLQVSITIFEEWSNNQINSLNEANPDLLDDGIDIEIFNPKIIGLEEDLGNNLAQYLFINLEKEKFGNIDAIVVKTTLSSLIKYSEPAKQLLSTFSRLSFIEKIDVITELLIRFESETLVNDLTGDFKSIYNTYDVASLVIEYKKTLGKNGKSSFPYKLSE